MHCGKCGAEMTEGASFCPKCGTRQEPQSKKSALSKKTGLPIGGLIGIVAAGLAVTAAIVAVAIHLLGGSRGDEQAVLAGIGTDGASSEEDAHETPLYSIQDVMWVDITAQNYAAGTKQPGMTWDSSLFYWLEDVNTSSLDDGYIASCRVTKTLLRDAQSQKLRQYEIYSDPVSGAIYKIVSIEETDSGLNLVDYYYQNGQPNFVFQREDTVYTPTYATIEKVGERYYFNNETMVRWRMIRNPGEIGEYTLSPREVKYSQGDYYAESDELRNIYDGVELRVLNAAHNTYDAIAAGGNIGMVQGYLQDTVGNGIAGKTVRVYRVSDNVLLYETATDDSGQYVFFVYLDDTECYVKLEADDRYKEMTVQGVRFAPSSVTYTYGLTMHMNSGDEYPVALHLYSCMDVVSDDNGTTTGGALQTVTATVREGAGNYNGESLCTVETQNGELAVNLPSGVYTVQFHAEGYLDGYKEVEVMEAATAVDAYAMPGVADTQTGVILTWDSDEVDLDLTLFTPYQAAGGDMAHIGGSVDWDGNGNMLIADNKSKCEVIFINSGVQGSFKLYVNNYTDSVAGNYRSDALCRMNVHVYLYNSNGFVADYTIPLGQSGVVWEVAEINGGTVASAQRVYADISGKSWWTGSKEVWSAEEDAALLECLEKINNENGQHKGYLRDLLEHLLWMSEEKVNMLCRGEKAGIEIFFGLGDFTDSPGGLLNYKRDNYSMHSSQEYELNERLGNVDTDVWYTFLTKEQADYLISSICGKTVDFDFSTYYSWIDPYIGCPETYNPGSDLILDNISVERVSANTWKVRGYAVSYSVMEAVPSRVRSRVCFTVVKNPESCFDGYSLVGFEVEEEANTSWWAKFYYDYLTTDPEGIAIIEDDYGLGWQGEYVYDVIYVDDDMVPEIYLEGLDRARGDILLHISNGKVTEQYFSNYGGSYIPYTGLMENADGHMGYFWSGVYKLEKGNLIEIGGLSGHYSDIDPETGYEREDFNYLLDEVEEVIDSYRLNGTEVTKEQYEEAINSYTGGVEFQGCVDVQASSLLDQLHWWCSER